VDDVDRELDEILEEARRQGVEGGQHVSAYVHQKGSEKCLVLSFVADDALGARRLTDALYRFCDARGYKRRFLVVRSSSIQFGPETPDRLPDDSEDW
jgi:hypothetical protein